MDNEIKQAIERLEKIIESSRKDLREQILISNKSLRDEISTSKQDLKEQIENLAVMTQQGFEGGNSRLDEVRHELIEKIEYIESHFADKDFVIKQVIRLEHFIRENVPQVLRLDNEFKTRIVDMLQEKNLFSQEREKELRQLIVM